MAAQPSVRIVILNYNTRDLLVENRRQGLLSDMQGMRLDEIMQMVGNSAQFEFPAQDLAIGARWDTKAAVPAAPERARVIQIRRRLMGLSQTRGRARRQAKLIPPEAVSLRLHAERRIRGADPGRAPFPDAVRLARECVAWGPTREALSAEKLAQARRMSEAFDHQAGACGRAA